MSFYDTTTGLWSETDPREKIDINALQEQFPGCGIVVRSDGVIEIQRSVSPTEQAASTLRKV